MRVAIYHNSLWAKYKGAVFSAADRLSAGLGMHIEYIQITETEDDRVAISGVDLTYHTYPYRLLFHGSYEAVSALKKIVALTRDLVRHPADLVVLPGYDRIENWSMLLMCMLLRRPRAVFCDSTMYDRRRVPLKDWAKRIFFSRCIGFLGYGLRSKQYLMMLGAGESDIVIPCQAAALPHDYDAARILTAYEALPADTFVVPHFLYVGRLAPEKGLIDLLDAFSRVRTKLPSAHLDLVGAGPLQSVLVERLRELGLSGCVTFHGSKSLGSIAEQFYTSVAFVLPSRSEPWGLVVNEALSYGCPVVVSDRCGCTPELVIEGVTGYGFRGGDADAMSTALIAAVNMSNNRRTTAARCIDVVSQYTPERAASRILEGCAQFLGRSHYGIKGDGR